MLKSLTNRLRAFHDLNSWILVVLGALLFSARVQFAPGGFVNLPMAFTVLQTGGLMFSLFGLQMMASMAVWPDIRVRDLLAEVHEGRVASATVLVGLLVFNGLSIIGASIWLTSALGVNMASQ